MRLLLLVLAFLSLHVRAQEPAFPQRGPLEITVLFPAGSSADVTARMLAEGMSKQLGQRVLVVNRPGAGGAIGYKYAAAQKPDGYALVWNSNSISTTYHSGQLPFDYRAFDAVACVLSESPVLAVRADARWKTLGDFVADARARPKAVAVGHSGVGSHTHISLAALENAAGIQLNEVPFSAAQVVPSLLGGHVEAILQLPAALSGPIKQGQVRLLAALIPERDPALPEVPTAKEQGFDVALEAWRGIAVPHGTPPAVIATLDKAIKAVAESPEFAKGSENLGVRPAYLPADAFSERIARDDAALMRLMTLIGLKKPSQ
ncbi:MAG TPA: tripartite tricarboxylate transporter substrate binding protein [Burkholderiales bacterium]|jgi:tripartite-type tricarboxylate transporter receptor subunit TctC|nr:tripartite tricarboxylate transporter substrate binding protein [Burkholderiales bacterium]